jgi:hypothetical protein
VKLGFTLPSEPGVVREELVVSIELAYRASVKTAGALSEVWMRWPAGKAVLAVANG